MKVILLKDVKSQGKKGDVVTVSDGYARNYLFPNGLAEAATATVLNSIKISKEAEIRHRAEDKREAEELAKKLSKTSVTVKIKTGANGKLFGSLNTAQIAEALAAVGIEVDKRKIVIAEPIKTLGRHTVTVKPYAEVSAKLTVVVESEN